MTVVTPAPPPIAPVTPAPTASAPPAASSRTRAVLDRFNNSRAWDSALWGRMNPRATPPLQFFFRVIYGLLIVLAANGVLSTIIVSASVYDFVTFPAKGGITIAVFVLVASLWPLFIARKSLPAILLLVGLIVSTGLLITGWLGWTGEGDLKSYAVWIWWLKPAGFIGLALFVWLAFRFAGFGLKDGKRLRLEDQIEDERLEIAVVMPEWVRTDALLAGANLAVTTAQGVATAAETASQTAATTFKTAEDDFNLSPARVPIKDAKDEVARITTEIATRAQQIEEAEPAYKRQTDPNRYATLKQVFDDLVSDQDMAKAVDLPAAKAAVEAAEAAAKLEPVHGAPLEAARIAKASAEAAATSAQADLQAAIVAQREAQANFNGPKEAREAAEALLRDYEPKLQKRIEAGASWLISWALASAGVLALAWLLVAAYRGWSITQGHVGF